VEEAAEKTAQSDKPAVSYNKEGIPVFRPSGAVAEKPTSKTPPTYLARFEGNVDGRQDVDGATQARLTAQVLQIVREFGASESRPTREVSANGTPQSNGKPAAESSTERLILTWEGPLVVESLSAGDSRKEGQARSRIEASGQPARLAGADGEVVCEALSYEPDDGLARFTGSQSQPAVVRSARDGEMRGRSVALRVEGERFFIDVEGPGRVQGDVADVGAAASAGGTGDGAAAEADVKSAPSITFSRELHATGRVVEQLEANLAAATLRRTKARLLETMTADGDVRAAEKAASLSTDSLDLRFGLQKRWGADKLFVERVLARGQTLLQDKDNRMSSRELEVELIAGATGKSLPVRAVATGGVSALQGGRTLTADDELVIDFERLMFTQVRAEAGSASAPGMAAPATQVPQAVQGAPVAATSGAAEKAVARTLRARGNVTVNDPGQGMELTADEATCSLKDGEVEQALVAGTADAPATVRTPKFAVTGANIRAHIPDEWAEVPGEGRMTIHSLNDLSGRRRPEPKPIAVTWKESMGYRGRENVAHFRGGVHASDDDGTTFDCRELRAEFIVQPPEDASEPEMHWGFFQPLRDQVVEWRGGQPASRGPTDLNRDLSSIYASGDVVMQKVNADAAGTLKTRARISGPKLALNLREETSRALIEGAGNLQLEDFETTPADVAAPTAGPSASLLSLDGAGPSKTLVQWTGRMWYDFSIDQIRFEEGVDLRHLSGKQLERFFQVADRPQKPSGEGLASFLTSDLLVLDFVPPQEGVAREFGRISADQIREFRAQGNVRFQDETKKLSVEASEVIYPKARRVLIISGMPRQKARIVQHRDGALPTQLDVERAFINLATNEIELAAPVGVQGG
jgi:hypothetical protein